MQQNPGKILLKIGRQSSGEAYFVDMVSLPNLFISHSLSMQLPAIFISIIDQLLLQPGPMMISMSLSRKMAEQIKPLVPAASLFIEYLHDDFADGKINSADQFIRALIQEMKFRKAFNKKPTEKLFIPPMLVFMDDIFEFIMPSNKKTALSFIELLLTAASVDMYLILGSSGIYRNLLVQLINVSPSIKKKLNKSMQAQSIGQSLGAELVMNPDGLLFYREKGEKVFERLFPFNSL